MNNTFLLNTKKSFAILILTAIFFLLLLTPAYAVNIFGGRVLFFLPCNTGIAVTIGPPRPGFFLYVPFLSTTYREYQVRPPSLVLGNYTPVGLCIFGLGVPPFGYTIPTQGTIKQIGTSF
jgi:hypothetical protein